MPSINKRGNTYRIMVSLGYDIYGKQIRKTTTFTPPEGVTEGKAEKLATAFAYEFEKHCNGMINMNENIRFDELQKWYFEEIAVHKLKASTFANSRVLINLYVLPYIGHMKLKEINTAKIDKLFSELLRNGRKTEKYKLRDVNFIENGTRRPIMRKSGVNMNTLRTLGNGKPVTKQVAEKISSAIGKSLKEAFEPVQIGGSLEVGTIKRIRTALSPIFATAVKKELLAKNPVTNATTPTNGKEKEKEFLNSEECKSIFDILSDFTNPQLSRVVQTLIYTGMRVGELTALHWDEVDLDMARITVKYNFYRLNGEYVLDTPKTKSSARMIALPPQLVELLREQKQWQENRKLEVADRWIDRNAVFTGQYGEYMNKTYINTKFKELLKKHNFPDVHIHDLRHANASLLINMGVPVKVIAEHLGHCDTRTTEKIYAHIFEETMVQASDAIAQALITVGK